MHYLKYGKTPVKNQYGKFPCLILQILQIFCVQQIKLSPVGKLHLHPMFVNTKNTFNTHMCRQAVRRGKPVALINTGCLCLRQKVLRLYGVNHGSIWTEPHWICLSQTILKALIITSKQQILSNILCKCN